MGAAPRGSYRKDEWWVVVTTAAGTVHCAVAEVPPNKWKTACGRTIKAVKRQAAQACKQCEWESARRGRALKRLPH